MFHEYIKNANVNGVGKIMSEENEKKQYKKPQLEKYGDISVITMGMQGFGGDYNQGSG